MSSRWHKEYPRIKIWQQREAVSGAGSARTSASRGMSAVRTCCRLVTVPLLCMHTTVAGTADMALSSHMSTHVKNENGSCTGCMRSDTTAASSDDSALIGGGGNTRRHHTHATLVNEQTNVNRCSAALKCEEQ